MSVQYPREPATASFCRVGARLMDFDFGTNIWENFAYAKLLLQNHAAGRWYAEEGHLIVVL